MPEFSSSTYSATDASNTAASPDGAPEGMAPSGVNNTIRALIGGTKRFWQRIQTGGGTFGGGTNAYTITYSPVLAAYVSGERYSFVANADNTGTATLNINSLGAKTIKKVTSSGKVSLVGGDIKSTQPVTVEYDGTDMIMVTPVANVSLGTVTSITAGTGLSGGTITSTGTVAFDLNSLTTKTTPVAGADFATIYDVAGTAAKKTLVEKLGRVVQRVYDEERTYSSSGAGSYTQVAADDTKPDIGEGVEILSASITPTSASNRIRARAIVPYYNASNESFVVSIHRAGDALASTWTHNSTSASRNSLVVELEEASPGTSSVTYTVRFSGYGVSTAFEVCGGAGARKLGGALTASLVIEEIVP